MNFGYSSGSFKGEAPDFLSANDKITEELFTVSLFWFIRGEGVSHTNPFDNLELFRFKEFESLASGYHCASDTLAYLKLGLSNLHKLIDSSSIKTIGGFINDREFEGHNERDLLYHLGRIKLFYNTLNKAQNNKISPIIMRGSIKIERANSHGHFFRPEVYLYDGNHRLLAYMLKYKSLIDDFREYSNYQERMTPNVDILYTGRLSIILNSLLSTRY